MTGCDVMHELEIIQNQTHGMQLLISVFITPETKGHLAELYQICSFAWREATSQQLY